MPASSPLRRLPALDFLRAIAVFAVFAFHTLSIVYGQDQLGYVGWIRLAPPGRAFLLLWPLTLGWAGVAVFFVVSGFCIHLSFRAVGETIPRYFRRRFFRIYPPFLVVVLLCAFLFPRTRLDLVSVTGWQPLLEHLFLVNNLDYPTGFLLNGPLWSVAAEAQLYCLYPLLLLAARRWGWRRCLAGTAVAEGLLRVLSAAFIMTGRDAHFLTAFPLTYAFSWSLGAALAERWISGERRALAGPRVRHYAGAAIFCAFVKPLLAFSFPLFALATARAISDPVALEASLQRLPSWLRRHGIFVGSISYGLYLLHFPLTGECVRLSGTNGNRAFFVAAASWVLLVPLGALFHRFVEQPSLRLGRRTRGDASRPADAPAPASSAGNIPATSPERLRSRS